jgi:chromosome segregation ATPase
MELTSSHAIQGIMVLATIAGGYAVVKANLSRVMEDLEEHIKKSEINREKFDSRLDNAEQERGKIINQVTTLKGINSPNELKLLHRELEGLQKDVHWISKQLDQLNHMHNGSHPPVALRDRDKS